MCGQRAQSTATIVSLTLGACNVRLCKTSPLDCRHRLDGRHDFYVVCTSASSHGLHGSATQSGADGPGLAALFALVLAAIVVLFATGTHLYTATFRAARLATGNGSVPLGWNVMLILGITMMLIFGHIYFAGFKKYRRAVAAGDWTLAAKAASLIHTMTLVNFALGWLSILSVRLLR